MIKTNNNLIMTLINKYDNLLINANKQIDSYPVGSFVHTGAIQRQYYLKNFICELKKLRHNNKPKHGINKLRKKYKKKYKTLIEAYNFNRQENCILITIYTYKEFLYDLMQLYLCIKFIENESI